MKAGMYVRSDLFSKRLVDDQRDYERAIDRMKTQIAQMTEVASENSWEVVKFYEDDGQGNNFDRPVLQSLLRDVMNGDLDIVVTPGIDRLARNGFDLRTIFITFDKHNVGFYGLDGFETITQEGKFFAAVHFATSPEFGV